MYKLVKGPVVFTAQEVGPVIPTNTGDHCSLRLPPGQVIGSPWSLHHMTAVINSLMV